MLKKVLVSVAAVSLAASPVLAQAGAAHAVPEPAAEAAEAAEGNELFRGGIIIPTLAVLAAILVILALTDTWPFDDEPASP